MKNWGAEDVASDINDFTRYEEHKKFVNSKLPAQISDSVSKKRVQHRTFLEELWSQEYYVIVILIRANVIDLVISPVIFLSYHTNTCIYIPSV